MKRCCLDTDDPDVNEFGCWCGVFCAAATKEYCEKRNCQRGFESLEMVDGMRHEGNRSLILEGGCGP